MSKIIYLFIIGVSIAVAAVFFTLYQPINNQEKNISVPVVKKIIDAKPVIPKKINNKNKDDSNLINLGTIRVNPEGGLVVAGKVYPNSEIEIISDGKVIAKTMSDKTGEFVIVSKNNLKSGNHILSFKIITPEKKIKIADQAIAIKISDNKLDIPIVAIIDSEARSGAKVVQAPGLEKRKVNTNYLKSKLPKSLKAEISIISLTNNININQIILSGYAIDGIQVDARISGKEVYSGKIIDNEWSVTLPNQLISGKQKLIASLIDKKGKIIAKDSIEFFGKVIKDAEGKTLIVVQKGDALWKIAYQRLGGGDKYLDILQLNKEKIQNPNLIYPKQLFLMPK